MSEDLIFEALHIQEVVFSKLLFYCHPLCNDPKCRKFLLRPFSETKTFYFVIFFFEILAAGGSASFTLLHKLFSPETTQDIRILHIIPQIAYISVIFALIFIALLLIFTGPELVFGINQILYLKDKHVDRSQALKIGIKMRLILTHTITTISVILIFLVPFVVYANLDPFFHVIEVVTPKWIQCWMIKIDGISVHPFSMASGIIRFFLSMICVTEASRLGPGTLIVGVHLLMTWTSAFAGFFKKNTETVIGIKGYKTQNIQEFLEFWILFQILEDVQGIMATLGLSVSLAVSVIGNFATIKLYSRLPMAIYLFAPICSITFISGTAYFLPPAITLADKSIEVIRIWKQFSAQQTPYMKQKLTSLRRMTFTTRLLGFTLFNVEHSCKLAHFETMLSFTQDAVLSVNVI